MAADPLAVLRAECELVSAVVLQLSEADFALPTRCTAWDVKELLGHMYRDVDRVGTGLATPPPGDPDTDAVSYWTRYDRIGDAPDIADRAKQVAAAYATGADLAAAWDQMWRATTAAAEREDRSRVLVTWGPALTLDEFLKTRVLEVAVHGLDLADALGRSPWATDQGLLITRSILFGLLGAEPPGSLGWDEVTFVEAGTGRRPLPQAELDALGPLAARFPLLG